MTRAIDRLLVSGAVGEGRDTPIGWVLSKLDCEAELGGERGRRSSSSAAARRSSSGSTGRPSTAARRAARSRTRREGQLAPLRRRCPPRRRCAGWRCRSSSPVPAPPLHRVRQLSYSALALFERCSYRYYAERVAGLRERRAGDGRRAAGWQRPRSATRCTGCSSWSISTDPRPPDLAVVASWYPHVSDEELERIAAFVARLLRLRARRAGSRRSTGVRPERAVRVRARRRPAARPPRRPPARAAAGRSSSTTRRTCSASERPDEVVEADYRLQRLVYALACFRAGAEEVEVVYTFLERPDGEVVSDVHPRRRPACSRPSSRRRSRGSMRACSRRTPASSRAPAARRSTSSAPARSCPVGRQAGRSSSRPGSLPLRANRRQVCAATIGIGVVR